jgi:small-conductance mechanosensitive channel
MVPSLDSDTLLDLTLLERISPPGAHDEAVLGRTPVPGRRSNTTISIARPPVVLAPNRADGAPPPPVGLRSVQPAAARGHAPRIAVPLDLVTTLCFVASAALGLGGVVVAAMALAAWQGWVPAAAAALFGFGGLLLAVGAGAMFLAAVSRYSATRYDSKKSVVARAR